MTLAEWAEKYRLPQSAIQELADILTYSPLDDGGETKREAVVQANVRLEASRQEIYLWRNNVGAGKLANGLFMRWGLANTSSRINQALKSADLIGGRRRFITPQDVGRCLLLFTSRECKSSDWKYRGTPEEQAQLAWANLINGLGGDAKIVTGPGSFS